MTPEYKRQYRLMNLQKMRGIGREESRRFRETNVQHLIEWRRKRYQAKRDALLQKQKEYRQKNIERIRERDRTYYAENKDVKLRNASRSRKRNAEKIRVADRARASSRAELKKKRYHADIQFKIKVLLRSRLTAAVRSQGTRKCTSTAKLIGCSIPDLLIYLESQFESGMSWKNYGKVWHVDHIMPLAIFDLSKSEHQLRAFHFSNLQPLFASENCSKGSKVITNQFRLL